MQTVFFNFRPYALGLIASGLVLLSGCLMENDVGFVTQSDWIPCILKPLISWIVTGASILFMMDVINNLHKKL